MRTPNIHAQESGMPCPVEFEESIYTYLVEQCRPEEQNLLLWFARRWEATGVEQVIEDTNAYEKPYVPARRWFRFARHLAFVEITFSGETVRIVACRRIESQPDSSETL